MATAHSDRFHALNDKVNALYPAANRLQRDELRDLSVSVENAERHTKTPGKERFGAKLFSALEELADELAAEIARNDRAAVEAERARYLTD